MLTAPELTQHIKGCVRNSRESQEKIYSSFYGYALSICERYAGNHDDALEILNEGFLKIFREVHKYKPAYTDVMASFKGWLRKIMVYTSIDHYRKNKKHLLNVHTDPTLLQIAAPYETVIEKMTYDEIIRAIRLLSPAYRTVFNLFVIEGLSHQEISKKLGIAEGTSKSNLSKARIHLQHILLKTNQIEYSRNVV